MSNKQKDHTQLLWKLHNDLINMKWQKIYNISVNVLSKSILM